MYIVLIRLRNALKRHKRKDVRLKGARRKGFRYNRDFSKRKYVGH